MFSFFMTVNGGLLLLEVLYARYSVYSLLMKCKIHFYISIFERWIKNTLIVKTYSCEQLNMFNFYFFFFGVWTPLELLAKVTIVTILDFITINKFQH